MLGSASSSLMRSPTSASRRPAFQTASRALEAARASFSCARCSCASAALLTPGFGCRRGRAARSSFRPPPSAGERDHQQSGEHRRRPVPAQEAARHVRRRGRTGAQRKAFPQAAQVFQEVGHGQLPVAGVLRHRTVQDVPQVRMYGNSGSISSQPPQRIDVARNRRPLAALLLRAGVPRRQHQPRHFAACGSVSGKQSRRTEIHQLGNSRGSDQDVRRLDIAVHNQPGVQSLTASQIASKSSSRCASAGLVRSRYAFSGSPRTNSITRNERPPASAPQSIRRTMPGW